MNRREFEEELRAYKGHDPFEVWHRYILNIEQNCPEGTKESSLVELLDRCFRTFNNEPHYKNDQRYVSAWVKYANFCKEPLEIYSYMKKQGIGITLALLYEAWANVAWQLGRLQDAELILQEGIRCQAQPLDQLQRKKDELKSRGIMENRVPGTGIGNLEKSSRDGPIQVFNDENVDPNMNSRTKYQGQKCNDENVNPNLAPKVQIFNENLKPSVPPQVQSQVQVHQDENLNPNANQNQKIMYCKEKLLMGSEELTFEELRAQHWFSKQKTKQEIKAVIDEEKRSLEEEKKRFLEEMERKRAELVQEAEKIKQEWERFQQVKEMHQHSQQQQAPVPSERVTVQQQQQQQQQLQQQQQQLQRQDQQEQIQQRQQLQQQQQQIQQRQQQFTETEIQQRLASQLNIGEPSNQQISGLRFREAGAMKHLNFGSDNSFRSDMPRSASGDQTEDFGICPITSQISNSGDKRDVAGNHNPRYTPGDQSFNTPNDSQTSLRQLSSGRQSLTAPSPTVNTREALQLVQGFFNASLDLEKVLGWEGDMQVLPENDGISAKVQHSEPEPPKPSGGLMFSIYDETQESENKPAPVNKNVHQLGKENSGQHQIPRQNLMCSVKPQKSKPPSLSSEFSVLQDGDTQMEGIESQAMDDLTIAPVGSHLSFAAAAHIASTPFNANNSHGPQSNFTLDIEQDVSRKSKIEEKSGHHESAVNSYQDPAMQPNNLSPIMEGSNEESSGHQTGMTVGADSVFHSSRGRHPSTDQKPNSFHLPDLESHHDSAHLIDTSGYIPLDLDEKTEALLSMSIRIDPHNPFDSDTIAEFLAKLPQPLSTYPNYIDCRDETMQIVNTETIVSFGGDLYSVEVLVGKGGYASVYKVSSIDLACESLTNDSPSALKVQKPSNPWEFYICCEIHSRLRKLQAPVDVSQAFMSVEKGYFFENSSCLLTKYFELGTVLDLVNLVKKEKRQVPESLAMYCAIELIRVVENLQRCEIIHGDIKPDNFLVCGIKSLPVSSDPDVVFGSPHRPFQLIDFGQSIDMTKYPPDTTFMAQVKTSGFQCIEMKTNMPWTFQTDMFGLVGTIHVLVFGQYMKVYKANDEWRMNSSFNRGWCNMWKSFFHTMLNIPSCKELPDLGQIRRQFELYFTENLLENFSHQSKQLNLLMMRQGC